MKCATWIALVLLAGPGAAWAQSLPVLPSRLATPDVSEPAALIETQAALKKLSWWLPLRDRGDDVVQAYYGADTLSGASKVEFLYGMGASRTTLRAELATLLFPNGLRLSMLAAVSSDDDSSEGETPATAIEALRTGGDTSLRAVYPVIDVETRSSRFYIVAAPSVDFTFDGPAKAETITQSTQWATDAALEAYWEYKTLDGAGRMFAVGRIGWQRVSGEFRTAARLESRDFKAMHLTLGLEFANAIRVSIQRYNRPKTVGAPDADTLPGWRLITQFTPKKK